MLAVFIEGHKDIKSTIPVKMTSRGRASKKTDKPKYSEICITSQKNDLKMRINKNPFY